MRNRCGECYYYNELIEKNEMGHTAYCNRFPPIPMIVNRGLVISKLPDVSERSLGCGEFKPKEK